MPIKQYEINYLKRVAAKTPVEELSDLIGMKKVQIECAEERLQIHQAELKILEDELARRRGK